MPLSTSDLLRELKPYIIGWVNGYVTQSGGYAPTDLPYVLGTHDYTGDLSEEIPVGRYAAHPDMTPGSPNAYDDEFHCSALDASWTQLNWDGVVTAAFQGSHLVLYTPANAASNVRMIVKASGATPWTLTAKVEFAGRWRATADFGLVLRDSTTGKLITCTFRPNASGNLALLVRHWTDEHNVSVDPYQDAVTQCGPYIQISDDGTNLHFLWSPNGYYYGEVFTEADNAFMTIDQMGLCLNGDSSGLPNLEYWLLSDWVRKT